jgi:hypothetical protein
LWTAPKSVFHGEALLSKPGRSLTTHDYGRQPVALVLEIASSVVLAAYSACRSG